jgi:hypothetical protein
MRPSPTITIDMADETISGSDHVARRRPLSFGMASTQSGLSLAPYFIAPRSAALAQGFHGTVAAHSVESVPAPAAMEA